MFTISSAAADRNLLTLSEMKTALGLSGNAKDAELTALGLRISAAITAECGVPRSGVTPPTLRRETIVETYRQVCRKDLILSRRFVSSVTSIVEDGATLAATDYEIEAAAGILSRLDANGRIIPWRATKIVATYVAGFDTVPDDLKLAATHFLREQWSALDATRDPLLRAESADGFGRLEYWVGGVGNSPDNPSAVSPIVASMLDAYRYPTV